MGDAPLIVPRPGTVRCAQLNRHCGGTCGQSAYAKCELNYLIGHTPDEGRLSMGIAKLAYCLLSYCYPLAMCFCHAATLILKGMTLDDDNYAGEQLRDATDDDFP